MANDQQGTEPSLLIEVEPDVRDVVFKRASGRDLKLDVYRAPDVAGPAPTVLWVGGGGWRHMGKAGAARLSAWLTRYGFNVVGIEYRVSSEAIFPAQIQDCLAALRWLVAHAAEYEIDVDRIGVWGDSAGGHLVLLMGLAAQHAAFNDGEVSADVRADVHAVCSFFPPTDFASMPETPEGVVAALLGESDKDADPSKAAAASPTSYVAAGAPPVLLVHGDVDRLVPIQQSHLILERLQEAGASVELLTLPGVGHQSDVVYHDPRVQTRVLEFFIERLRD